MYRSSSALETRKRWGPCAVDRERQCVALIRRSIGRNWPSRDREKRGSDILPEIRQRINAGRLQKNPAELGFDATVAIEDFASESLLCSGLDGYLIELAQSLLTLVVAESSSRLLSGVESGLKSFREFAQGNHRPRRRD